MYRGSTSPSECALAVCIPLTWEQFATSLDGGRSADFASSTMRNNHGLSASDVWDVVVRPEADRTVELIREAKSEGVTVCYGVGRHDLAQLFGRYQVVTLLSHWRPGWLYLDQINSQSDFERVLLEDHGAIFHTIRENIALAAAALGPAATAVESLVFATNLAMKRRSFAPSTCPTEWHESDRILYRVYANRVSLDRELKSIICRGNCMELADGMISPTELISLIPSEFDAVLDLTICNSIMIAEEIKRTRTFTCLANEDDTELSLRIEIYRQAISVISKVEYRYDDAVRDIRIEVLRQASERKEKP